MLQNDNINVNKVDQFGVNAFWIAAFYGHVTVMKRLIGKGADIYSKNHNGSNVLHIVTKKNNIAIVEDLIKLKYPLDN